MALASSPIDIQICFDIFGMMKLRDIHTKPRRADSIVASLKNLVYVNFYQVSFTH